MVQRFYILNRRFGGLLRNPFGSLTVFWLQRFLMVKPCPKDLKCDVEVCFYTDLLKVLTSRLSNVIFLTCILLAQVSSYAIRDVEDYKNFCDRPRDQRPLPEEVIGVSLFTLFPCVQASMHDFNFLDIAEPLSTIYLNRCERGKRCLYEGSTPPGGFPNSWNGATHFTSELMVLRNNEIHTWDRGYDDEGNQVWGVKEGPYEFKPAPASSFNGMFSPLNFSSIAAPGEKDRRVICLARMIGF
ncbi:Chromophore lyase CpcT/CpeT 3 [Gossypium australe]|uniref:Chromophore lyase CpcT/CpeT 3 n=1 Tax=Gossypium australe TaxID=47621 RepID=A0A5B6UFI7_9ROSI|nr:Chromophore lyase CpcT/CpeT 3 [Gossypium australe]